MLKADKYHNEILERILSTGFMDINPRPRYADGTPAHTKSINHVSLTYDLSKGEFPMITLRPIAIKKAIGEILWIYQDQSTDLNLLKDKYGITWWDSWDIGNRTIGSVYGATVREYDLMNKVLDGLKENPDSRYHIINLWQYAEFEKKYGLKPCAFMTMFNVVHKKNGDYLDMVLVQRSSDFIVSGTINQMQYVALQMMVARHCGLKLGQFTWVGVNVQIYDRHVEQAREMITRSSIANCSPRLVLNPNKTDFYSFTVDDFSMEDYPLNKIKEQNPQLQFEIAI